MVGRVLIIAGSDSGGGAGIQADIKSSSALGAFATTAITALTAQNTLGVHGVMPVPVEFIDQQIKGPYAIWHHTHTFEEKDGGTIIKDNLTYAIPMGIIGRIVHFLYIRHDINGIFKYRHKILDKIFSEIKKQSGKSL